MLQSRRLLFSALVGAAACGNAGGADLATQFYETPFRLVPGVQMGMRAQQLKRARPATRYSPYLGLQENVPGHTVSYVFSSATQESPDGDVDPRDQLRGIYMSKAFGTAEAATAAWREQVAIVSDKRRAPDMCERFPSGGLQARWFSGRMALAIATFPADPSSAIIGPRVIFGISPMETMKQPEGATPTACPTT